MTKVSVSVSTQTIHNQFINLYRFVTPIYLRASAKAKPLSYGLKVKGRQSNYDCCILHASRPTTFKLPQSCPNPEVPDLFSSPGLTEKNNLWIKYCIHEYCILFIASYHITLGLVLCKSASFGYPTSQTVYGICKKTGQNVPGLRCFYRILFYQ